MNDKSIKTYRIATWNLERPIKRSERTSLILECLNKLDSDILILTETSTLIELENYNSVQTDEFDSYPGEQWSAILTKWKIEKRIDTFDMQRTVAALIDTPFGKLLIYATIIPYHMAGVKGGRYGELGYKVWQMHEEDIVKQSADWKRIKSEYPDYPLLVIGDYNQTRDGKPKGYGTDNVRNILSDELTRNNLTCVTEIDFEATGQLTIDPKKNKVRRNVDHIAVSSDWINKFDRYEIGAWDHFTLDGLFLSDHNGVCLDFELTS